MSDTGGTCVVSGIHDGLGTVMIRELHGIDIRTHGDNRGGKADAPSAVKVLAADLSPCSRLDKTRNTASQ